MMKCLSCKEEYGGRDVGTCRECYEEAGETEEELKREIEDLKTKVNFLRLHSVVAGPNYAAPRANAPSFSDVVLVASDSADPHPTFPPIPAHRAVLVITNPWKKLLVGNYCYALISFIIHLDSRSGRAPDPAHPFHPDRINHISRSPVFRAMLENKMEESLSGTIKISDVSYDALRAFVSYLYTADANLDEHMAIDLLVLAEKYEVKHLKTYCEKYLMSKLNWENSLAYYAFAHQHYAKSLLDAALSLIVDNMDKLTKQEEYMELVEKDPRGGGRNL